MYFQLAKQVIARCTDKLDSTYVGDVQLLQKKQVIIMMFDVTASDKTGTQVENDTTERPYCRLPGEPLDKIRKRVGHEAHCNWQV